MRKVTKQVCQAFIDGKTKSVGNTYTDGKILRLFGNTIAEKDDNGDIWVTMCGHPTTTTRERLNGICQLIADSRPFYQHKHTQYFNGSIIDSRERFMLVFLDKV